MKEIVLLNKLFGAAVLLRLAVAFSATPGTLNLVKSTE